MLALFSVAVGVLVGWTLGGDPRRIETMKFRGFAYVFTGLALQTVVRLVPAGATRFLGPALPYVYPVSLGLVLLFIWSNRHLGPPIWLIFTGCAANVVVILANGGRMPVSLAAARLLGYDSLIRVLQAGSSGTHQALIPGSTHLALLADLFALPPVRFAGIFSVGDILLVPGVLWLTVQVMGGCSRRPKMLE